MQNCCQHFPLDINQLCLLEHFQLQFASKFNCASLTSMHDRCMTYAWTLHELCLQLWIVNFFYKRTTGKVFGPCLPVTAWWKGTFVIQQCYAGKLLLMKSHAWNFLLFKLSSFVHLGNLHNTLFGTFCLLLLKFGSFFCFYWNLELLSASTEIRNFSTSTRIWELSSASTQKLLKDFLRNIW